MPDAGLMDQIREAVADRLPVFRKQVALGQAYARVFSGPEGRLVLTDILRKAGILEAGYAPGMSPSDAVHADGRRVLGLEIIHQLRWTEGELLALAQERTAEEIESAREGAATGGTGS